MKKVRFFSMLYAVVLGCASTLGHAGMVLVEQIDTGDGTSHEITIKIKDDKMRMDTDRSQSVIFDTASGDVTTLLDAQKKYLKMSGEQLKAFIEKAKRAVETPVLVDAGAGEKIADYDTEIYTHDKGASRSKIWVAKNFPNYEKISAQLEKLRSSTLRSVSSKTPKLPGMVVKTETTISTDMGWNHIERKVTSTLISAKEQPIDGSEFVVPANFTEVKMPVMPTIPSTPSASPSTTPQK